MVPDGEMEDVEDEVDCAKPTAGFDVGCIRRNENNDGRTASVALVRC